MSKAGLADATQPYKHVLIQNYLNVTVSEELQGYFDKLLHGTCCNVLLNLSLVDHIDTITTDDIIHLHKQLAKSNRVLKLTGVNPQPMGVFRQRRMHMMMDIRESDVV